MKVLLTGATGFIGGHVAWSLLQHGHEVAALVRPTSRMSWRHDSLDVRAGDVRDAASVRAAMVGCDAVVHAAAHYALWSRDPGLLYDVNVQGTRNVLRAAVEAGVQRIVHTSTVGTIRFRRDALASEADEAVARGMTGHYKRSKWEAERFALRLARAGAPVVVVNPTAPIGSGDVKPTPTGAVVVDFLRGRLPAVVDTGLNFVDVTDVADGHVLALEKGVVGQRYILGNADGNMTLSEFLGRLAKLTGLPAPKWRVPHAAARLVGGIDDVVEGMLLGREPRVPLEGVRMAHQRMWVDPSKAVLDLGMPQSSVDDAVARAVAWYVKHEYAPVPPSVTALVDRRRGRGRRRRDRVR